MSALLGGEGAVLAVANALQLEALGVEQSQKRARQARNLDGWGPKDGLERQWTWTAVLWEKEPKISKAQVMRD